MPWNEWAQALSADWMRPEALQKDSIGLTTRQVQMEEQPQSVIRNVNLETDGPPE